MSGENRIPGSFRDPSGYVFRKDGGLFRRINKPYIPHFNHLIASGLYETLTASRLLIPHKLISSSDDSITLSMEELPFISYPYEWSFSMLKDAALATLEIQKHALAYGMSLKDASAFNIQFHNGKALLIDTLSFQTYVEGEPWVAYAQFCRHFLAPLLLAAYIDVRLTKLLISNIDGIPLDLVGAMLPLKAKVNPAVLLHIMSHLKAGESGPTDGSAKKPRVEKVAVQAIVENLHQAIKDLKPQGHEKSVWSNYYDTCTYTDAATQAKVAVVEQCIDNVRPKILIDMGANTGRFSRVSAGRGVYTIAMDYDPWCVDGIYRQSKHDSLENVLPLVQDAVNPTPSIGWALNERESIIARSRVDMLLALAIIHHLAIANNVPLEQIAEHFAGMTNSLLIEFVPKEDVQVKSLLALREDIFPDYHVEGFLAAFQKYFQLVERFQLPDSNRELFLFKTIKP